MSRLNRLILCCVIGLVWLAPGRVDGQAEASGVSDSNPSRVWAVIGGSWVTIRGDCTFCEVQGIEAHRDYSWGLVGDIGVRVNNKTDAGLEVAWMPATTRSGTPFRATFLLGIVQFRPWESQGFFIKGGMGMAFTRNFLTEEEDTITQKALAVDIGGGWAFRPDKRVGFQLHGTLHVAALGDFVTSEGVLENVMGNFWSLGGAVVIR
jgi:hypothetical protein